MCARPTVRPGRTVHDERDHGDGSDTRLRGRQTRPGTGRPEVDLRASLRQRVMP